MIPLLLRGAVHELLEQDVVGLVVGHPLEGGREGRYPVIPVIKCPLDQV